MSIRDWGRPCWTWAGCIALFFIVALVVATICNLADLPSASLAKVAGEGAGPRLVDRAGLFLNRTYQKRFNAHDLEELHDVPDLLVKAFITAEDSRFFRHHGADWLARLHALWQNLKAFHPVRGASTITEQVVRILFPRPRTYWSRWLEGWDAMRLEERFAKPDILEFYLNQVPFASGRRGIVQAARFYFGRSLDTLNTKEMLALAAMVRAPSLLDPFKGGTGLDKRISWLAMTMQQQGHLSTHAVTDATSGFLSFHPSELSVEAPHFLAFVRERLVEEGGGSGQVVRTTLDGELQDKAQRLLEQRLTDMVEYGLHNGAVLVVDHTTAEVLVWAVAGEVSETVPGQSYDAVRTPRQPGSTLKPFVYALALDSGWLPATLIKDEPIVEAVEHGLHVYRNFSQTYYGMVPLAEALGNSLNTPAVKTLDFVGLAKFHATLREMGMRGLVKGAENYGKGLVLGNAEVSLLELVQAYGALARGGVPLTVKVLAEEGVPRAENGRRLFSARTANTIGTILSEADCRSLEFGSHSVLDFPIRTAVKTGTSTEGNDVWTVAYDGRYVVGIWLGNMDRSPPLKTITGVGGPALLARSVFAELRKRYGLYPLPTGSLDLIPSEEATPAAANPIRMVVPAMDMEVLLDPRIPTSSQLIPFSISGLEEQDEVEWNVDGKRQATSGQDKLMWPVTVGSHEVTATITRASGMTINLPARAFTVK